MDDNAWNEFLLAHLPTFLGKGYQEILQQPSSPERVKLIIHLYILLLRTLALYLVSQYLTADAKPDAEQVVDAELNRLLILEFPGPMSPDLWQSLFFTAMHAYEGKRRLFFMQELYDWYWNTSASRHQPRPEVVDLLKELTRRAVVIQGEVAPDLPQTEAEWTHWEQESLSHLKTLFRGVSFLSQYPLIRVLTVEASAYQFELHQGLTMQVDQAPLPPTRLRPGYLYLRKQPYAFLQLHPLLILWGEQDEPSSGATSSHTGIYDALVYDEAVRYLLATSDRRQITLDNERMVKELLLLVFDALAQRKQPPEAKERLTWWYLRDICQDITHLRMSTVRHKFRPELYHPRVRTQQAVERFLRSEKRCLALIGKSGVGKTSFLLSLASSLPQTRSDLCVLMYDGANLSVQPSITHLISQDFAVRFKLPGRSLENIWQEIDQIEGIQERTVLLIVDALNEHPQAKELLRQVDGLVQWPWPWLKIVFSCRPESWRTIKRGVKLAEALYYQADDAKAEEIWELTSPAEQMEPFSRDELPQAYGLHQERFHLQTAYEDLSPALREMLRDPLTLWLVARTHQDQPLPALLQTTEVVGQYVDELVQSKRLERVDLDLLEDELVPLMVREGHYTDEITRADLSTAGERLSLKITSEEQLSSGRPMNQSFQNLVDAELLVRREERRGWRITFKYERFYEYFIGERIFFLCNSYADRPAFFAGLIGQTTGTPFLWGAVRNALLQEAVHTPATIIQLCFTDQQRVKEMLVDVLVQFGLDHPEQAEERLQSLLPPVPKATAIHRIRGALGKTDVILDPPSRNAGKIAVEIASRINRPLILQRAALQADPTIRKAAVRYSYHLWQRDHEAGFDILVYLTQHATKGLIPDLSAFESAFVLSTIIFFAHYQDDAIRRKLQSVWKEVIARLLHISKRSSRWGRIIQGFLREKIFSLIYTVTFRLLSELPYTFITDQRLAAFFKLGESEKAIYRRMVQYIDIQKSFSLEEMERDYFEMIKYSNIFFVSVDLMGLVTRTCAQPLVLLPFLQKLFEQAKREEASYPYLSDVVYILSYVLDHDPGVDQQIFDYFNQALEECQVFHKAHPEAVLAAASVAPEAEFFSAYIIHHYRRTGNVKTEWVETRINTALAQSNQAFFDVLFNTELPLIGIEGQEPGAALQTLDIFFKTEKPKIASMILEFLARLRSRYPEEVDDFLEEHQASVDYRLQVQTREPAERAGELIGAHSTLDFLHNGVIKNSPELRAILMEVMTTAADCKNLQTWLDYVIRKIVNLVYGGEALHQTNRQKS